jgi:uncharacterized membrane protein (DUF4010 family)
VFQTALWPYLPTLARLALALAIGLFVGIERERRRKEAGLRTFAFASVIGCVGGLLGTQFAMMALGLLAVLVVLLNIHTIREGEGAEITTSAALLLVGFIGVLVGQGHKFTPTALGVITAALLTWKKPLAGFSHALTDAELRSAVLLAIIAFVIYPILPQGSVDPWRLVDPRSAWVTVILIAALGFTNYILLKLYGLRGFELAGFLGGLVNSTVTVTELARRVSESGGTLGNIAYRGIVLATGAMLIRNGLILGLLAPMALRSATVPLLLMLLALLPILLVSRRTPITVEGEAPSLPGVESPFSLKSALRFGIIFLALRVAGTMAQRALGNAGFYAVSATGGVVSSASAVASAANLASSGTLSAQVAASGAILASLTSIVVNLPIAGRVARDRLLFRRMLLMMTAISVAGAAGLAVLRFLPGLPTGFP